MRDTEYATELATGSLMTAENQEARIERIYVKNAATEEIRFSWWKNGAFQTRPLDIPENQLLDLFRNALDNGVFSPGFRSQLKSIL